MTQGRSRTFIKSHPGLTAVVVVVAIVLGYFLVTYFEPHKLFIDDTVNEALPRPTVDPVETETSVDEDRGSSSRKAPARVTLASGPFHGLEHDTSGNAIVLELADGRRFLRFENFETSNGPDLRVYLSQIPAGDDWFAYGERFIDLGPLKGNIGDQNYAIPDEVDLSKYRSAVIWCRQFSVGFGVAPLEA